VARALFWSGESPFYYLIAWLAKTIGNSNGFVLRIPSMAAMGLAAYLVYRIGARLLDREAGLLAALFLVCSEEVAFAAVDARPYALAMLMLLAAVFFLLRWLESGGVRDAAGYVVFSALAIYAHYIFSAGLLIPALYAVQRVRRGCWVRYKGLFGAWALTGLLVAPTVPNFLSFYRTRSMHLFAGTPSMFDLLQSIAPLPITAILIGAGLALYLSKVKPSAESDVSRSTVLFLVAWAFLLPVLYFVVSVMTDTKIFVARYFLSTAPGVALLAGWIVRRAGAEPVRRNIALSLVIVSVFSSALAGFWHGGEDWRGAMAKVRDLANGTQLPVLICTGFVEGGDPARLADRVVREAYLAPLALYPGAGQVIPLPYRLTAAALPYMEQVAESVLRDQARFIVVARGDGELYQAWLQGRFSEKRYRAEQAGNFGNVHVTVFSLRP
jgi:4-amino-4-deoxy-L-arabinose transferase-like glycosyltransferase